MTWVIGAPTMFGYSVAMADIQVTLTFPNGKKEYIDALQKLFLVGRFVAAGFSGSVEVGYILLDDLIRWAHLPNDKTAWIPDCLTMKWRRRAKYIFSKLPKNKQRYTEILLASVYPQRDNGIPGEPQTYYCILRSPNFDVEKINPGKIGSIGSGNNVIKYKKSLEKLNTGFNPLMQLEVGTPGGYGQAISMVLSLDVKNYPTPGISPHFHIVIVRRGDGKMLFGTNNHVTHNKDGSKTVFKMPVVASTWREFKQIIKDKGFPLANIQADA